MIINHTNIKGYITTLTMRGKTYDITDKTKFLWNGKIIQLFPNGMRITTTGIESITLTKEAEKEIRSYTWNTGRHPNPNAVLFTLGFKA